MSNAVRIRPANETASVLIQKPIHRRLKKWAKERGLKLGYVTEKAIEQFMAETAGGAR